MRRGNRGGRGIGSAIFKLKEPLPDSHESVMINYYIHHHYHHYYQQ